MASDFNYATERFSDCAVDVHILLREPPDKTWTVCTSVEWVCEYCYYSEAAEFVLQLYAAAGHRPRAGLVVGSRSAFEYAPEPGETIIFGASAITYSTVVHYYDEFGRLIRWTY